ncbi:MAG: pyridoxal phosphate-dependent aminotransferase [bacterium]
MKNLNDGILAIKPSQTLAIASLAKQMVEQGQKVCNFAAGEPDFDTPEIIKQAAVDALRHGKTKYTPVAGVPMLCQALSEKFKRDNALDYKPSQIIVSCGGKHSLALVFQTLLNPGDEVMIPVPFWLSYPEMVRVAGGVPVFLHTTADQGFKITPQHIERLTTSRTKAIVINSPSNPTGVMYTPSELQALGETARKHEIAVVSDEIYEKMVYDGNQQISMASFSQAFYDNTITVNGFSKTYSMTGWRLGYTAGPETFIKAMNALQSHCASAPNTFAQWGAVTALEKGEAAANEMIQAFDARRRRIYELISAIPGIQCVKPSGAFYVFPNISSFGLDSMAFSKRLLEEEHVAVVPGVAFGANDCVRLSYACGMAEIEEGMTRLARFCAKL